MLRRSTGFSEDMNRVGVSKENECGSGEVKWRCVAAPRLEVVVSDVGASGEVVGVGGLLEAMELRRLVRGSRDETSLVAIMSFSPRRRFSIDCGDPQVVVPVAESFSAKMPRDVSWLLEKTMYSYLQRRLGNVSHKRPLFRCKVISINTQRFRAGFGGSCTQSLCFAPGHQSGW